jgi:hypothetical protein
MSASGLRMTRQVSEAVDALARGWGRAETSGALTLLVFLAGFFVRSEGRFFVPTCPFPVPTIYAFSGAVLVASFAAVALIFVGAARRQSGPPGVSLAISNTTENST